MNRSELRGFIASSLTTDEYQQVHDHNPLPASIAGATPVLVVAAQGSEVEESQSIRNSIIVHTLTATIFVAFDPRSAATVAAAEDTLDRLVASALHIFRVLDYIDVSSSVRLEIGAMPYRAEQITVSHREVFNAKTY